MKTIKLFLIALISFFMFTNNIKADTIEIHMDTIPTSSTLVFCDSDTIKAYKLSSASSPYAWITPSSTGCTDYDHILITNNSFGYFNGVDYTFEITQTNGLWYFADYAPTNIIPFNLYFTSPITEPWSISSDAICGSTDTLYANNYQEGLYYQWYEVGVGLLSEGYYPNDTALIVDHTADYVVGITGCNGTVFDTISMTLTTTNLPDLGQDHSFCGTSVYADLFLMEEYDSYLWSTGSTDSAITITSIAQSPDTIWVEVENQCIGTQRDTVLLFQEFYPTLDIGPDTIYMCPGDSVTLSTGFEYYSIMWKNASDSLTISTDTSITIYTDTSIFVRVRPTINCPLMYDYIDVILTQPYEDNNVCVATVDTNGYNKVVWDRTFGVGIESYNIYRLNVSTYDLIGNVPIGDNPIFYDLGADPMVSANRYKIAAVDTCGNESSLSYYHGTIHITSSPAVGGGIDLTITDEYEDESGNYSPVEYYVMIDSLNSGHFEIIDTMSAAFSSYHIATPWSGATYALAAGIPWACEGAKSGTMSLSNKSAVITDIEGIETKVPEITVYPNPSSGIFHFDGDYERVEIFNSIGQSVLHIETNQSEVNLSNFSKGVYYAKIETAHGPLTEKLILR